jgi:hypothetical protein
LCMKDDPFYFASRVTSDFCIKSSLIITQRACSM